MRACTRFTVPCAAPQYYSVGQAVQCSVRCIAIDLPCSCCATSQGHALHLTCVYSANASLYTEQVWQAQCTVLNCDLSSMESGITNIRVTHALRSTLSVPALGAISYHLPTHKHALQGGRVPGNRKLDVEEDRGTALIFRCTTIMQNTEKQRAWHAQLTLRTS